MKKIRTVVIEDEKNTRAVLIELIRQFCPELEVIGEASSVIQAITLIKEVEPELVFLDIKLGEETGFDVLSNSNSVSFETIFTTAYENFALKAIKHRCIDYLMKPIDINELMEAVSKVKKSKDNDDDKNIIKGSYTQKNTERIGLPAKDGIKYIETKTITFLKADGPYTHIYFSNKKPELISKTLKYFERILDEGAFKRTHRSFMVNINHIERYEKIDGGCLILKNGKVVPISRRLKTDLLEYLK